MKSTLLNGLKHFFTTRESLIKTKEAKYKSLADENIKMFCKYFNVKEDNFIYPEQTHSTNIKICKTSKSTYPDTDGLILTNKEQAVHLNFADCTPLIFYDDENNIAAISHAGWRGTAGKIAVKTVKEMQNNFGTKPENLKCAIGPTISFCCYNVGENVCNQLISTVKNADGLFETRRNLIYVDLKGINKKQLNEIGVTKIDVCPYCTVCDNDKFFSYRKENKTTNRHSAIIFLG